jgi:hypothetical protein
MGTAPLTDNMTSTGTTGQSVVKTSGALVSRMLCQAKLQLLS